MKTLMLRLEPVIWLLFGAGIMLGTLLLPGYLLTVGIGGPLGAFAADALSYDRLHAMATHPIGGILFRLVLLGLVALPLWKGAHHLRALSVDFDGHHRDGVVGSLLYAIATVGSLLGIYAVFFRL
ncbi:fumarate reductase subunit D [Myxococcaceae bacterium]|nr:fumarate reductase subunit D [Myxococcaceae bacterium]